ncbi:hypothetical protein ACWOBL_03930 [Gemella bergeri]
MEQKQLIAAIKKMDTASISDAMDKLGISCGLFRNSSGCKWK